MNDIYAMAGITKQGFYGRLSRAKNQIEKEDTIIGNDSMTTSSVEVL